MSDLLWVTLLAVLVVYYLLTKEPKTPSVPLVRDGKEVGRVTSLTISPHPELQRDFISGALYPKDRNGTYTWRNTTRPDPDVHTTLDGRKIRYADMTFEHLANLWMSLHSGPKRDRVEKELSYRARDRSEAKNIEYTSEFVSLWAELLLRQF